MKIIFQSFIYAVLILSITSCSEENENVHNEDTDQFKTDSTRVNRISRYKIRIDSLNRTLEWRELDCGLWLSNNNMLALKSQQASSELTFIDRYLTKCKDQDLITLIDTSSFSYVGSSFYKDMNNVYTHYINSDGGFIYIVKNADVESFVVLEGGHYAKDKNHIYDARHMALDSVDYETFRSLSIPGFLGKDKNGYYQWGEKFELDSENLPKDIKKRLIEL